MGYLSPGTPSHEAVLSYTTGTCREEGGCKRPLGLYYTGRCGLRDGLEAIPGPPDYVNRGRGRGRGRLEAAVLTTLTGWEL